jgi:hypothetical protein
MTATDGLGTGPSPSGPGPAEIEPARTGPAPMARIPPATGEACVLVIGMHRSGTSATAGLLAHLGLAVPSPEDLLASSRAANERGHWESRGLLRFNNRLLRHLGGTWSTPPRLEPGWEGEASLDSWREEAASVFGDILPARPAVWKDPRNCVLLPFWRTVLAPPVAAVFVLRHPAEVSASLRARDAMPVTYGLAVWERYVRSAAAGLTGLPTLVGDYRALVADPEGWCERVVGFLEQCDVGVDPAARAGAAGFVDGDLRHQRIPSEQGEAAMASTTELWRLLAARTGEHRPWLGPDLGSEPQWVDDVLTVAREAEVARIEQAALNSSRAYRVARAVTGWRRRWTRSGS